MACFPDGARIVSGSEDTTVRIWNAETGREFAVLRAHEDEVTTVACAPDGKMILSGSRDKTVGMWKLATTELWRRLRGHEGPVASVSWSPDQARIASASLDGMVRVWDVMKIKEAHAIEFLPGWCEELSSSFKQEHAVCGVAWLTKSVQLIIGLRDSSARVWDAINASEILSPNGRTETIWSIAWSPNGTRVASASDDSSVAVWNSETGDMLYKLSGHKATVWSIAWSPDGKQIVTGSADRSVRIWDAATGKERVTLNSAHDGGVRIVAFSPDGSRILSGSEDHSIRLWDGQTGRFLISLRGHDGPLTSADFSPDATKIVSGSWDGTVRVFYAPQRTVHDGRSRSVLARLFKFISNALLAGTSAVLRGHTGIVWTVTFSPDGTRIISGAQDGTVRVWEVDTYRELASFTGNELAVTSIACSPDSRRYVSCSIGNDARLWDAETFKCLNVIEGCTDTAAIAAGAGKFPWLGIVRGSETVVQDATTGRITAWYPVAVGSLTTAPNGRRWAGCSRDHFCLIELESCRSPTPVNETGPSCAISLED